MMGALVALCATSEARIVLGVNKRTIAECGPCYFFSFLVLAESHCNDIWTVYFVASSAKYVTKDNGMF